MGALLGLAEGADQIFNQGRATNAIGNWFNQTTGLGGAQQVNPYQFDWTNANQTRGNETALLNQYQQMAAGNGPSLAQGQLQQATDQNIRQAMALGAAQQGQGLGYSSALRNIADQSAAARQQAAAQSALIRNQEQMQGMQGAGALLGQIGAQDYQQQGMGAQNAQYYGGLNANIDAQNAAGRRQFWGGVTNGLGGAVSTAATMLGMSTGGPVPGYASGGAMDSSRNDTVPAMLSPGEIVIPRSITMAPNAGELSRKFVEMVQQHRARLPEPEEHPAVRDAMLKKKAA